jgi:hypothetical protein
MLLVWDRWFYGQLCCVGEGGKLGLTDAAELDCSSSDALFWAYFDCIAIDDFEYDGVKGCGCLGCFGGMSSP